MSSLIFTNSLFASRPVANISYIFRTRTISKIHIKITEIREKCNCRDEQSIIFCSYMYYNAQYLHKGYFTCIGACNQIIVLNAHTALLTRVTCRLSICILVFIKTTCIYELLLNHWGYGSVASILELTYSYNITVSCVCLFFFCCFCFFSLFVCFCFFVLLLALFSADETRVPY